jgi:hypothetical protein
MHDAWANSEPRITRSCVTISWDDGHPFDLRVAELLAKYRLPATFYVPKTSQRPTMSAPEIKILANQYDIGAHTMHHRVLTRIPDYEAWAEMRDSKAWLEDLTGVACRTFCPPEGRFRSSHRSMAARAGFVGLRTVELGSIERPKRRDGICILPTSAQVFPHSTQTYARNALKRGALGTLKSLARLGGASDWQKFAVALLRRSMQEGKVFHIWGHSWEVEDLGLWAQVEDVFAVIASLAHNSEWLSNGELCEFALPTAEQRQAPSVRSQFSKRARA